MEDATGKANKSYKNSVFVDLFYEDEKADENDIALYNALHEEQLPIGTSIKRFRVENVLYMNFKNDVSFGVEDRLLVFGEHQSTINQNMPLRSLMYIGRAYEQLVPVEDRYRKKLAQLPTPEFYTFYNGNEPLPKDSILRLSDAFIEKTELPNSLELNVRVINIKPDEGHELLNRCEVMKEYALFVECVDRHRAAGEADAIEQAVKECIEKDILREYLKRKGSEVLNMLIAEYDYATDIRIQREEALEEGIQRGLERGREEGREEGTELAIKLFIETFQDLHLSQEEAMVQMMKRFSLGQDEAKEKIKEYWK